MFVALGSVVVKALCYKPEGRWLMLSEARQNRCSTLKQVTYIVTTDI
jgi:hypothetical protein